MIEFLDGLDVLLGSDRDFIAVKIGIGELQVSWGIRVGLGDEVCKIDEVGEVHSVDADFFVEDYFYEH